MRQSLWTIVCLFAAVTVVAAQDPPVKDAQPTAREERASLRRDSAAPLLTPPSTTPEMWLYEQERLRYEDPKQAVRRNAEYRWAQRAKRIESMRWFGMSNSRPLATTGMYYDTYSPTWVGNTFHPYEWSGVGGPTVVYGPGVFLAPGY